MHPVLKQGGSLIPLANPRLSCMLQVAKNLPCAGQYAPSQNSFRLQGICSKALVFAANIFRTKLWACNWTLLAVAFSTQQTQKSL